MQNQNLIKNLGCGLPFLSALADLIDHRSLGSSYSGSLM